jgi:outer membrane receptor protein involved in Fe transport
MMRKNTPQKYFILLLAGIMYAASATAQTVVGTVTDCKGRQVLAGVTVKIAGTSTGSATDKNGKYLINDIKAGLHTLEFSFVGMKPVRKEVKTERGKQTMLNVCMDDDATSLGEIIVEGKSQIQKLREQAIQASTIDVRAIYNVSGGINQYLNRTTGVRIRESGGIGSDYSFSLNGFSGRQVKIFLDGIPMDNFGSSWGLGAIPTGAIERIEVYKGVLPVHLGADALGGALNIISRREANYLDLSYSVGSFNTHRVSFNGAYTHSKTGYTVRFNTFYNYSDNDYRVYVPILNLNTNQKEGFRTVKRFHDNYRANGLKIETGITGKSFADYLLLGMIVSGDNKDIQTGVTMESVFGAKTSESSMLIPSVRYRKSDLFVKGLTMTAYGAYNMPEYHYIDTTARRYNWLGEWQATSKKAETTRSQLTLNNREWLANAVLTYETGQHNKLTLSYVFSELNRKTFDKEDPENLTGKIPQKMGKHLVGLGWDVKYDRWNAAAFLKMYNMEGRSFQYVNIYTDDERLEELNTSYLHWGYGSAFAYYIIPRRLQAKISYEHTYRLPEGMEMFGDGLFNVRNPNLKPENSNNINTGLVYEKNFAENHILFESTFLYRDAKDYIRKELRDPSTKYINLGAVKTFGVEGGLKYKWKNRLHAGANVTWQNITDNMQYVINTGYTGAGKTANLTYKDRLPNMPYLFANADAGMKFHDAIWKKNVLSLDYSMSYVHEYFLSWESLGSKSSKSIIPKQFSHNIAVNCTFCDGRYSLTLECINLTDEQIYDNYMLQKPGRAFYAKFRYFINNL